jgi:hypothetical protein
VSDVLVRTMRLVGDRAAQVLAVVMFAPAAALWVSSSRETRVVILNATDPYLPAYLAID